MKLPKLFNLRGEPKFVTDGCSGYMTWLWLTAFGHTPPWNGACVVHDWYYWSGGKPISPATRQYTRRQADAYLFDYIRNRGYVVWAWSMWAAVRVGGSQYLPFSWRWRYQENYLDVLRGAVIWYSIR